MASYLLSSETLFVETWPPTYVSAMKGQSWKVALLGGKM